LADGGQGKMLGGQANEANEARAIPLNSRRRMYDPLNVWDVSTPVIENSEPDFRKGSKAEIQTQTLPQSTGKAYCGGT
jgi:hypothetical protein